MKETIVDLQEVLWKHKQMKETIVDLQEAYELRKFKAYFPQKYAQMKTREARWNRGVCMMCGKRKLTSQQIGRGTRTCVPCKEMRNIKSKAKRRELKTKVENESKE